MEGKRERWNKKKNNTNVLWSKLSEYSLSEFASNVPREADGCVCISLYSIASGNKEDKGEKDGDKIRER